MSSLLGNYVWRGLVMIIVDRTVQQIDSSRMVLIIIIIGIAGSTINI